MAIGSRSATPACGEDKHDHPAQQQRGQNHGYQLPPSHEELRGDSHGDQRYDHRGGYGYNDQQHYGYIYAPPPVAYMPQPSPGITLVFPLQFR
ncbi:hypothetical protein [Cupriavidus basilensis]|uniref:hypothetical protein n=1 Tax=Cupriavidus basilensis TaxID=68895 RepID=UPI0023E849D6|nr:hypothetical protein [Cupriavidus basilensis]MDF3887281.1 hypothetical protein [Cupriavidus basilensis]